MNLVDEAIQKTLFRQVATEALRQSVPRHDPGLEALQRAHQAIGQSRQMSEAAYGTIRNHEPASVVIRPTWDNERLSIFNLQAYPSQVLNELIRGMSKTDFLSMIKETGIPVCDE